MGNSKPIAAARGGSCHIYTDDDLIPLPYQTQQFVSKFELLLNLDYAQNSLKRRRNGASLRMAWFQHPVYNNYGQRCDTTLDYSGEANSLGLRESMATHDRDLAADDVSPTLRKEREAWVTYWLDMRGQTTLKASSGRIRDRIQFRPLQCLVRASSALNRWFLFGRRDGPLVVVIVELAYKPA